MTGKVEEWWVVLKWGGMRGAVYLVAEGFFKEEEEIW
jgi:hypothetical protein